MENQFQPSFVPRRPIIPNEGALRPRSRTSFFVLIASAIFVLAVLATAAVFAYKAVLTKTNETKQQKIQDAIQKFDPEITKQLTIFKARIDNAKQLLQSHAALSTFLSLLEQNTAQTIRYTSFSYATGVDKMTVVMKGESTSYAAIAFQSDVLSRNDNLKSVIFSNLNLAESGLVGFDVKADIDPKLVSYRTALTTAAASAATAASSTDTTVGTDTTVPGYVEEPQP